MNIVKAYELLIAAQGGRAPVAGPTAGDSGNTWLSAGIYGAVRALDRLVERLRGER